MSVVYGLFFCSMKSVTGVHGGGGAGEEVVFNTNQFQTTSVQREQGGGREQAISSCFVLHSRNPLVCSL